MPVRPEPPGSAYMVVLSAVVVEEFTGILSEVGYMAGHRRHSVAASRHDRSRNSMHPAVDIRGSASLDVQQ